MFSHLIFFASLMGFLCLRILVGCGRSSFVRPHPIPLAMLFREAVLVIMLSGRWTVGTTCTTTSLHSPCLFTCNMCSCKRCCCARFGRFETKSTLVENPQRWRVVLVSRSIAFAEAFMFHRILLVSTLVFLVYYVIAIFHVSVCSPAMSLLLFSYLSHSFLLPQHCCRNFKFFFDFFVFFFQFLTIAIHPPVARPQKTGFPKNRFSTGKLLIF